MLFLKTSSPSSNLATLSSLIGPVCLQAIDASEVSVAIPIPPVIPPLLALLIWHVTPEIRGSWNPSITILWLGPKILKEVSTYPTSYAIHKDEKDKRTDINAKYRIFFSHLVLVCVFSFIYKGTIKHYCLIVKLL